MTSGDRAGKKDLVAARKPWSQRVFEGFRERRVTDSSR